MNRRAHISQIFCVRSKHLNLLQKQNTIAQCDISSHLHFNLTEILDRLCQANNDTYMIDKQASEPVMPPSHFFFFFLLLNSPLIECINLYKVSTWAQTMVKMSAII